MATLGAYIGSTFQLLFTAASVGFTVFFATLPHWGGAGVCAVMAAISSYVVVSNDWPKTWKPLLTKGGK